MMLFMSIRVLFPLAFNITASLSLGENIFPSLRSLMATFRIDFYAMYFCFPAVGRPFCSAFIKNDNLNNMGMVNNELLFEFVLKPPQYKWSRNANSRFDNFFYYIKVSGIPSGGKLIKTIRYPHMWRYDIFTCEDIDDFIDIKFVS